MDAAYLREHVGDALAEGLSATIVSQPDDSVAYLGRFLLKYVDRKEAEEKMKEREAALAREEEEVKRDEEEASAHDAPARERQRQEEEEAEELEHLLETAEEVDDSIWARLLERVRLGTGAVGVYVAKKEPRAAGSADAEGDEGEEDAPTSQLRYIATTEDHAFLRTQFLDSNQGVTFDAWQEPAKPEEEEGDGEEEGEDDEGEGEDGGAAAAKEPPPLPDLPVVQVDNVLLNPRVHFFRLPKLGAYVAVPLRYRSALHPAAIPESEFALPEAANEGEGEGEGEGEEEGDEEQGEEGEGQEEGGEGDGGVAKAKGDRPIPAPVSQDVDLAICFDTLGKDHRLTSDHVELVKRWVECMRSALERTEKSLFEAEVGVVRQLPAAEAAAKESLAAVEEEQEAVTEEVQQGLEAKLNEIRETRLARAKEIATAKARAKARQRQQQGEGDEEKEGEEEGEEEAGDEEPVEEPEVEEASVPDVGALERSKGVMRKAGKELQAADPVRALLSRRKIPPSDEHVKVLHTALRLRGVSAEDLGDAHARDPLAPAWRSIRSFLSADDFAERCASFDPAEVDNVSSCLAPPEARAALEGLIPAQGEDDVPGEGGSGEGEESGRSVLTDALLHWARGAIEALEAWEQKQAREKEEAEAHETALKAAEEGDQTAQQQEEADEGEGDDDDE